MESSIRLGRVFGIPIGLHYSWFLVFFLVTFLLSDEFGNGYGGWGAALATTLLFFLSVLVHEMSHSLVALAQGIPVKGITLFIFGGVSQIGRESSRPSTEFIVAAVGPLSSVGLGFAFLGAHVALGGGSGNLARMAELLFLVNVTLGIFNMLPGFPLDGGRVLRAALWWVTRSYSAATRVATIAGQGMAFLLFGLGVAVSALDSPVQGVWMMLIGAFLWSAASASHRQFRRREGLRRHTARELMSPQCPSIAAGLTLSQLVERYGNPLRPAVLLVVGAAETMGMLTPRSLASIPRAMWDYTTVESVATPLDQAMMVAPEDDALSVLELMEERDLGQVFIIGDGTLLGCVRRDSLHGLGQPGRAS